MWHSVHVNINRMSSLARYAHVSRGQRRPSYLLSGHPPRSPTHRYLKRAYLVNELLDLDFEGVAVSDAVRRPIYHGILEKALLSKTATHNILVTLL